MKAQEFYKKILTLFDEKREKAIDEAIEEYHQDRIENLKANNTYKNPFSIGPKVVIHLIPHESFKNPREFDLAKYCNNYEEIKPLRFDSLDQTFNFEGIIHLMHDREGNCSSYVQVCRNGVVEAVNSHSFDLDDKIIYSRNVIENIKEGMNQYMSFQTKIGISPPIIFYLSFLGVFGFKIPNSPGEWFLDNIHPIEREDLILPNMVIDKSTITFEELKPSMDSFWNACGYPNCGEYDKNGAWIKR
jgi:hypothetical protein